MNNTKTTFTELKISSQIIEKLAASQITEPTNVQKQAIPLIMDGKNILFQSETGTGKTFAFLLPLLTKISDNANSAVKIVIASPTVELASQIKNQVAIASSEKCALLVGAAPIKRQIETLKEKPSIVCGSAARIAELYHLKKLKLCENFVLVLDEIDRMFSKELVEETEKLISLLDEDSQIIGCSATVNDKIQSMMSKFSKRKIETVFLPPEDVLRKRITHLALYAERRDKIETLRKFIQAENPEKILIFTGKSDQVQIICDKLNYHKIPCEALSAKGDKTKRKAAIDRFKSGKAKILVTTDLASRGLDIQNITHVIQMDLPSQEDFFIHRSGRTARCGKTGVNLVIGDAFEMQKYSQLEKKLKIVVYPKMLYKGKLISPQVE